MIKEKKRQERAPEKKIFSYYQLMSIKN